MIQCEIRRYRLSGFTPILGSQSANRDVYTNFVATKRPDNVDSEEEYLPDLEEKGLTVFYRDCKKNDALMLMDYQIRGFLKSAGKVTRLLHGVTQIVSKVDNLVFVEPRCIHLQRAEGLIFDEDEQYERPLRCSGPRGERVALAASEMVNDPWFVEIAVSMLPSEKSKTSSKLTFEVLETMLDYGKYSGLGQFRNGGFGRFNWERIDV